MTLLVETDHSGRQLTLYWLCFFRRVLIPRSFGHSSTHGRDSAAFICVRPSYFASLHFHQSTTGSWFLNCVECYLHSVHELHSSCHHRSEWKCQLEGPCILEFSLRSVRLPVAARLGSAANLRAIGTMGRVAYKHLLYLPRGGYLRAHSAECMQLRVHSTLCLAGCSFCVPFRPTVPRSAFCG